MRRITLPAAALTVLITAAPALASAGLPKIASLDVGPHKVAIHGDSPSARIGSNMLTVEVTQVPEGHSVTLRFIGPKGQVILAPLQPLRITAGPPGGHGEDGGHGAASDSHETAPDSHGAVPDSHGTTHDSSGSQHGASGGEFAARTQVAFPEGGSWKAVLEIQDAHDESLRGEATFAVVYWAPRASRQAVPWFTASSGVAGRAGGNKPWLFNPSSPKNPPPPPGRPICSPFRGSRHS